MITFYYQSLFNKFVERGKTNAYFCFGFDDYNSKPINCRSFLFRLMKVKNIKSHLISFWILKLIFSQFDSLFASSDPRIKKPVRKKHEILRDSWFYFDGSVKLYIRRQKSYYEPLMDLLAFSIKFCNDKFIMSLFKDFLKIMEMPEKGDGWPWDMAVYVELRFIQCLMHCLSTGYHEDHNKDPP